MYNYPSKIIIIITIIIVMRLFYLDSAVPSKLCIFEAMSKTTKIDKSKRVVYKKRKIVFWKVFQKLNLKAPEYTQWLPRMIFLVFLPHGNFVEIIVCNFDMFKTYKRYQKLCHSLPLLLEQIRMDYRLWHFLSM